MVYIFEDDPEIAISRLILNAYNLKQEGFHIVHDVDGRSGRSNKYPVFRNLLTNDIIIFSQGNGNIKKLATAFLNMGEFVVAFVDVPIGNSEIIGMVNAIICVQDEFKDRFIIAPYISMEYNTLMGLYEDNLIKASGRERVARFLDIAPYLYDTGILQVEEFRSIEKKSKKRLQRNAPKCFEGNKQGRDYGMFQEYSSPECLADKPDMVICPSTPCFHNSNYYNRCGTPPERSYRLLKCLPYFPRGSIFTDAQKLNTQVIKDIINIQFKTAHLGNEICYKLKLIGAKTDLYSNVSEFWSDRPDAEQALECIDTLIFNRLNNIYSELRKLHLTSPSMDKPLGRGMDALLDESNMENSKAIIEPTSLFAETK